MEKSYIEKQIKKVSRNKIILYGTLMLGLGLIIFLIFGNPVNLFLKNNSLDKYDNLFNAYKSENYYVKQNDIKVYSTGHYSTAQGESNIYYYLIMLDNGNDGMYILYKSKTKHSEFALKSLDVTGKLTAFEAIDLTIYSKIVAEGAKAWDMTYSETTKYISGSFIIDGDSNLVASQIICGLLIALALFFVYLVISHILYFINPKESKIAKRIEKQTNKNLDSLSTQVEVDLSRSNLILDEKTVKVTDSFVVITQGLNFVIRNKSDLIWAYYTITQHRTNGIPTGKSYNYTLHFNESKKDFYTLPSKNEKHAIGTIEKLASNIETSLFGFDQMLRNKLNSNFTEFLTYVRTTTALRETKTDDLGK